MRKSYILLAAALLFAAMPAFAQSSKAAAAINNVTVCANTNSSQSPNPCTNATTGADVWYNVMVTTIKTSNVTDLFVSPSLVTGLYTDTTVKGNKTGDTSTAVAQGTVKVRVLLDPPAGYDAQGAAAQACQDISSSGDCPNTVAAYPDTDGDGVTFDQRIQTLSANLGFIYNGSGCVLDVSSNCTPEQIQLILDTTSAHTFNYILLNVGSGMHTVVVQAEVGNSNTDTNGGVGVSNALFGLGSLTVDAVRLVNSFSF